MDCYAYLSQSKDAGYNVCQRIAVGVLCARNSNNVEAANSVS